MATITAALERVSEDAWARWALWAACACAALSAIASLALPFGWDHGIMATAGSAYLHGGLPYADSWDMKGPAAYLPYTVAEALFGNTMWGVRVVDLLIQAVTCWTLFSSLRALTTWRIAGWAALGYYFWIASAGWFFTAAPETWVCALCILAIAPLLAPDTALDAKRLAFCGLLIGCAGLIKPFYFTFGLSPLLTLAFAAELSWKRRLWLALALMLGAAAPVALFLAYFGALGGLASALEVHVLYTFSTYTHVASWIKLAIEGAPVFLTQPGVVLTAPFAALGLWSRRGEARLIWPAAAWLGVALFCVAVQGKFWVYQWFPVYPPLLFLAALGAYALARSAAPARAPLILTCCVGLVFAGEVLAQPMRDAAKAAYYFIVKREPEGFYNSYAFGPYNAADERAAARHIAARSGPEDGVFIWGNDATVRYLAGRPNPTRFSFEMPLNLPGAYRDAYRAEAMQGLQAHPPAYIVLGVTWIWMGVSKAQSMADFPEFAAFLHDHYTLETSFGALDLYRRTSPGEPGPEGAPAAAD